jgi:hypothetical protein
MTKETATTPENNTDTQKEIEHRKTMRRRFVFGALGIASLAVGAFVLSKLPLDIPIEGLPTGNERGLINTLGQKVNGAIPSNRAPDLSKATDVMARPGELASGLHGTGSGQSDTTMAAVNNSEFNPEIATVSPIAAKPEILPTPVTAEATPKRTPTPKVTATIDEGEVPPAKPAPLAPEEPAPIIDPMETALPIETPIAHATEISSLTTAGSIPVAELGTGNISKGNIVGFSDASIANNIDYHSFPEQFKLRIDPYTATPGGTMGENIMGVFQSNANFPTAPDGSALLGKSYVYVVPGENEVAFHSYPYDATSASHLNLPAGGKWYVAEVPAAGYGVTDVSFTAISGN